MKKDEFGPQFEELLQRATERGDGITAAELASETGSSRQRAYAWVDNNRARLRATGKSDYGANRWILAGHGGEAAPGAGEIAQGARLLVRDVRWQGGLVLELVLDDGTVVIADIRQD